MIETQRLVVRPFSSEDTLDFFKLSNDEGFNLFSITIYKQVSVEAASEWISNTKDKYGVWTKASNELVGMGGLMVWKCDGQLLTDITYRFRSSAQGKGYGKELAIALRDYALKMKMPLLSATITPDNIASKKLTESLGLKFSHRIMLKGVETDLYLFAN